MYIRKHSNFIIERYENDILNNISEARFYISYELYKMFGEIGEEYDEFDNMFSLFDSLSGEDVDTSMSYLDVGDNNNTIKFINPNSGDKLRKKGKISVVQNLYMPKDSENISKNSIRIGRLIRKVINIYNNSFSLEKEDKESFTDSEIEKFVNIYKSKWDYNKNIMDMFELVSGSEIKNSYSCENYKYDDMGQLGSSCMASVHKNEFLNLYAYSDNVELLVLKSDDGLIIGRAIVWHLNNSNTESDIFMDRIYTARDSDVELFKKYAREHRWIYKSEQDMESDGPFLIPDDEYSSFHYLIFEVNVGKLDKGSKLPYADTMKYYYWESGIISNDYDYSGYYVVLESVDGSYECDDCDGEGVEECEYCYGGGEIECSECEGVGEIECSSCDGEGNEECGDCYGEGEVECSECEGDGEIEGESCESCEGNGREECHSCEGNGSEECSSCDGSGHEGCPSCNYGHEECDMCSGEGNEECSRCGDFANN